MIQGSVEIVFRLPDGRVADDIEIEPDDEFCQMIADLALEAMRKEVKVS